MNNALATWSIHIGDAVIAAEGPVGRLIVTLWGVRGLREVFYPTKMAAEVAARLAYPEEGPDQRYARVFFKTFTPQD